MKDKTKYILLGLTTIGLGIYELVKEQRHRDEMEFLNRKINSLGHCHNSFVIYQDEVNNEFEGFNEETNERLFDLEEEIISNYDHIVAVAEVFDVGD